MMLFANASQTELLVATFGHAAFYDSAQQRHTYYANAIKRSIVIANLLLILFGSIGNLFTFLILMRPRTHKHSCMRYLAALCLVDFCSLYTWNFSIVYAALISRNGRKIEFESALICRLFSFYSYFILQASSWIICSIGIDRLLTVLIHKPRFSTNISKHTFIVTSSTVGAAFVFNLIVIVMNAEPYYETHVVNNVTVTRTSSKRTFTCYEPKIFFTIWDVVHSVMYAFLPFFIILAENVLLSSHTIKHVNTMKLQTGHRNLAELEALRLQACSEFQREREPTPRAQTPRLTPPRFTVTERIIMVFDKKKRYHRKRVNLQESEKSRRSKSKEKKHTPKDVAEDMVSHSFIELPKVEPHKKLSNVSMIKSTRRHESSRIRSQSSRHATKMKKKGSHVTKLLLFLTVSFFFTTVPYSTFYALRLNRRIENENVKNISIGLLSLLAYARHAGNFLIYLSTSSIIIGELRKMYIGTKRSLRIRFMRRTL